MILIIARSWFHFNNLGIQYTQYERWTIHILHQFYLNFRRQAIRVYYYGLSIQSTLCNRRCYWILNGQYFHCLSTISWLIIFSCFFCWYQNCLFEYRATGKKTMKLVTETYTMNWYLFFSVQKNYGYIYGNIKTKLVAFALHVYRHLASRKKLNGGKEEEKQNPSTTGFSLNTFNSYWWWTWKHSTIFVSNFHLERSKGTNR